MSIFFRWAWGRKIRWITRVRWRTRRFYIRWTRRRTGDRRTAWFSERPLRRWTIRRGRWTRIWTRNRRRRGPGTTSF
jgi:hypothetical protein